MEISDEIYRVQMTYIEMEYNQAYYRWVFCPENERNEAKRLLDIWRHKYFSL